MWTLLSSTNQPFEFEPCVSPMFAKNLGLGNKSKGKSGIVDKVGEV